MPSAPSMPAMKTTAPPVKPVAAPVPAMANDVAVPSMPTAVAAPAQPGMFNKMRNTLKGMFGFSGGSRRRGRKAMRKVSRRRGRKASRRSRSSRKH